ncbi:MAG: hypothetical protein BGO63_06910 [Candidatus Accumulibacter sp. 66-26]|nr:MAG: hypothetical protein BGO63_06910 [Candidatus Accumulibacter sp. 66-26]
MLGLKQRGVPQLSFVGPRSCDCASNQAQRATGGLELRDVGQTLGKKSNELRMERVTHSNLLSITGIERPAIDNDPGVLLLLVIVDECICDSCSHP